MQRKSMLPNVITFNTMISSVEKAARPQAGIALFEALR